MKKGIIDVPIVRIATSAWLSVSSRSLGSVVLFRNLPFKQAVLQSSAKISKVVCVTANAAVHFEEQKENGNFLSYGKWNRSSAAYHSCPNNLLIIRMYYGLAGAIVF